MAEPTTDTGQEPRQDSAGPQKTSSGKKTSSARPQGPDAPPEVKVATKMARGRHWMADKSKKFSENRAVRGTGRFMGDVGKQVLVGTCSLLLFGAVVQEGQRQQQKRQAREAAEQPTESKTRTRSTVTDINQKKSA